MQRTKIVATIGPASQKLVTLSEMLKAGMSVARFNFSHGSYPNHHLLVRNVRQASKKTKHKVLLMQDLQGPKIRVKEIRKPLRVNTGREIVIGRDFFLDLEISKFVRTGQRILIQDGLIELKVKKIDGNKIHCVALNGGLILSHKGVNLPDTLLTLPSLTPKDIKDLAWGKKLKYDFVAISFVRSVADIVFAKKQISKFYGKEKKPKVIAKIETPQAVKNINAIIKAVDVIMVARGDLGVEMPEEQVPIIQNRIVKLCKRAKKPVIVATQMLESMVTNPRPTRAEVSDVADAVLDGADYVMLSEETATGKYPAKAVAEMKKIIEATKK